MDRHTHVKLMGMALLLVAGLLAMSTGGARAASPAPVIPCADLFNMDLLGLKDAPASVISATEVVATKTEAAYCKVVAVVQPQVQFELRLPVKDWNGRYFQSGCWGLCGNIDLERCADVQAKNFAVAGQNMGHVGHFWKDAIWATDPMLVNDFGKRSTHVTALAAKAIIAKYYGTAPHHSYFRGCSTGGREGLSEAQHFPEDFDGIISGDPAFPGRLGPIANNWDAVELLDANNQVILSPAKLQLLADAVMAACDETDGLKDGIIGDPRACHFNPETLACPAGQDNASCLTAKQVAAVKEVYRGPHTSKGIALAAGGSPYGSELQWDGQNRRSIASAALQYFAFDEPRPGYNYRDFDFDKDVKKTEARAALFDPVAPYTVPDLNAFQKRGGKLIVYHGWADPGVSPFGTLDYYAQVAAHQGGLDAVRAWFRVFMVPGMYHCRGGNAPNTFDFMPGIVAWVEGGAAPDGIIATQYTNKTNTKIVRARPLYAYPNIAVYKGTGDVNSPANWEMRAPATPPDDRAKWKWAPNS